MSLSKSEKVVVSSPMSYSGATQRLMNLAHVDNQLVKWFIAIPLVLISLIFIYACITIWYVCFGIFIIPWRLLRRSQRKAKKERLSNQEMLQAIKNSKTS